MWSDEGDRNQRRETTSGGILEHLRAVPTVVWVVVGIVLLAGVMIATRGALLFPLVLFMFFGWRRFGRDGGGAPWSSDRREHRSADWHGRHGGHGRQEQPTIRWGEAGSSSSRAAVRDVADPDLQDALVSGREQAARMRRSLGGINDREVRLRVTNLVDDADRILASLRDRGDVVLARTFNDRYLAPASTILTRYARLVSRDLTTARPVLDRVENHDLPLLQKRYSEFYEQVHRGDLIDLEVASEMLAFELDAPVNGAPSLSEPDPVPEAEPPVRWRGSDVTAGRERS